jgi:TPR repeat protein
MISTSQPFRFFILTKNIERNPYDSQSLCNLGKLYYKGHGTFRDINKAFECFKKAAELNNSRAQYKLGNMYTHKCGMQKGPETDPSFWETIPLDYEKAIDYYYKAAMHENPKAFCQLGFFNFKGIGMLLNRKKSFMWYNRAAAKGNSVGQTWLGCFYSHGAGLEEGIEILEREIHHAIVRKFTL